MFGLGSGLDEYWAVLTFFCENQLVLILAIMLWEPDQFFNIYIFYTSENQSGYQDF
jgi:hypothetical protein